MTAQSQAMRARLHLLRELRAGLRPPGSPISVKGTAEALRLSPTPVREALARLAGEGAVAIDGERNGFCVPQIGVKGYRHLTVLIRTLLDAVPATARRLRGLASDAVLGPDIDDPVATIEATFILLLADFDNDEVTGTLRRAGTILAPYWQVEPVVFADWLTEVEELRRQITAGKERMAIRAYLKKRLRHAESIVDAVERRRSIENIF